MESNGQPDKPRCAIARREFIATGAILAQAAATDAKAGAPEAALGISSHNDGLCNPRIQIFARQLPALVCVQGGADCPLIKTSRARALLEQLKRNPAVTIQLKSEADCVPHYTTQIGRRARTNPEDVFDRKRDLDVLQRLGLCPNDTRRARYLFERLFARIPTLDGLCAYATPGWEGCPVARGGVYEKVRAAGWQAVVAHRTPEAMQASRCRNVQRIESEDRLYVRPHHLMCLACGYAGGANDAPRPNDTLHEILQRVRREPDVPIVLVEGPCEACDCCDGFHPHTGRCVHAGGLIRDYKKDLDCFQKLGLMPGDVRPARELFRLLFERIPSTRDVCGYGDGITTCEEWRICSDPTGSPAYEATRRTGIP